MNSIPPAEVMTMCGDHPMAGHAAIAEDAQHQPAVDCAAGATDFTESRTVLRETQAQLARAESDLRQSIANLKAVTSELEAARSRVAEAEAAKHSLQQELARNLTVIAGHAERTRQASLDQAMLRGRAELALQLSQAILASRSWQAMAPLRRLVEAFPLIRPFFRGAGKLLPWIREEAPGVPQAFTHALQGAAELGPDARDALGRRLRDNLTLFLADNERLAFPAEPTPAVSVLIVLYNQAHLTLHCLRMILAQAGVSLEVVLVDNASTDETGRLLERLDGVRIIRNTDNRGFLRATNQAAAAARGRHLLLLNSDAFLRSGCLAAALETLEQEPAAGAVGGRLVLPSGLLQEAGCIVWADGSTEGYCRGRPPEVAEAMFRRDVDYCSGAFLLTPRSIWKRLGGLDDRYAPAYYEEVDYCLRLREAGLRVIYEPAAVVDHVEFGSQEKQGAAAALMLRNRGYFQQRHANTLRRDHLSREEGAPLLAREAGGRRGRRLLVIDDLLPLQVNGAGLPRARAIVLGAVAAGWSVTHYPRHQLGVDWPRLRRELPPSVEVISQAGDGGLRSFLAERTGFFDTILVSRPHNAELLHKLLSEDPELRGKARVIYDAEALYAARDVAQAAAAGRALSPAAAERLVAAEIRRCSAGVQGVTCVTKAEHALFRQYLPPDMPLFRLPHAVTEAAAPPDFASRQGFLFIGRLLERDAPNWQGLAWFLRECWPLVRQQLPEARLTIAGQLHPDHAELAKPGVSLLGAVEDLQPLYDAARVFLAPVRFAAGVPIKIVEATAAGLPTVSTMLMARQLDWPAGEALAAADDPAALAKVAVSLHQDPAAWRAILGRAKALLRRDFDAEAFQSSLVAALAGAPAAERAGDAV